MIFLIRYSVNEASREQEAVKLVVLRAALAKLSQAHLKLAIQTKTIFEALRELSNQIPDPPPPDAHLGVTQHTRSARPRAVLERVKSQVQVIQQSPNRPIPQFYTSTPVTSPTSSSSLSAISSTNNWASPQPSAPDTNVNMGDGYSATEPPPPYNLSYFR